MPTTPMNRVIQHLCTASEGHGAGVTDGELLVRFLSHRDESALAALVRRHGPMVWGVCCRLLRHQHDAEDAFQATFLVLLQKAATLPDKETVGKWLYGVAHQTAVRMRAIAAKRCVREQQMTVMPEPASTEPYVNSDLASVLDEELSRLPDKYRVLIVLCDLEGVTRKEVARQLGIPEGTAATRLAAARAMLTKRLARRGVGASGLLLSAVLFQQSATAAVPTLVIASTINAATRVAAGDAAAGAVSPTVFTLMTGVTKAMFVTKIKTGIAMLLAGVLMVGGAGVTAGMFGEAVAMAQPDAPGQKLKGEERAEAKDKGKAKSDLIGLGMEKETIITTFGKPDESVTFESGIESLHFQHGPDLRMLVEIAPKTGKVIQVYYRKKTPFTNAEISELLDLNAEGSKWQVERLDDGGGVFQRLDGGFARGGGKVGEEYQFAISTGRLQPSPPRTK